MKRYEEIKKQINECDSAMEMAGYLDGLNVMATTYCLIHFPDEVFKGDEGCKISILGMEKFLDSEI